MRKIILIYGAIAGLLMDVVFLISFSLMEKGILPKHSELLGYSTMIIVLSLIFFGIKSYRDKHSNGAMTYWKGFTVGISIAVIASLFYAAGWEVYYDTTDLHETFMPRYIEQCAKAMHDEGISQAEIDKKVEELQAMAESYKNPFIRFGMTLMEIFPVGLAITLISAGILRKKNVLPG